MDRTLNKQLTMTDEELMQLYQLGKQEAFEALYDRYERKVRGYLRKRRLSDFEMEEVFQRVFIKLHVTRQNYNDRHPFSSWIFTLTRSVMIDFLRSDKKWKEASILDEEKIPTPPPEEKKADIDLSRLKKKDRELLQDRFFDEKTYQEISQKMGISQVAIRQKISRAVAKLRHFISRGQHESS